MVGGFSRANLRQSYKHPHKSRLKIKPYHWIVINTIAGVLVFFVLVHFLIIFERDSPQSSLIDYQNGIWYAFVTLSTVGYGDVFPVTIYGRVIGYIFIICSLGVYGLLIGKIASLMTVYRENKKLGYHGTSFTDHAIILGWNEFGRNVADQLVGVHKRVAIITNQAEKVEAIREIYSASREIVYVLHADYRSPEAMKKANFDDANVIFVNLNEDMEKLVYVLNLKKLYPSKHLVVILNNSDLKHTFQSAGVMYAVAKNNIASKLLASYIFEPDVAEYSESILSFAEKDTDYDIKQYRVTSTNPYRDREYQYAFFDSKKRFNAILIGVGRTDSSGRRILIKNPIGSFKLEIGDYLILIINAKSAQRLEKIFQIHEGI